MAKDLTGLEELLETSSGPTEILHFYNGTETLYYDHGLHAYYQIKNDFKLLCPGSTTVCGMIDKSGPLTQWAANMTVELIKQEYGLDKLYADFDMDSFLYDQKNLTVKEFLELLEKARFNFRGISKDATDIGHMAHEWLEEAIKHRLRGEVYCGLLPPDPRAVNCVNAALDWMEKHQFTPRRSEFKVFSREFGYAGTADFDGNIITCDDPLCCGNTLTHTLYFPPGSLINLFGDFKSSRSLYDEYRAQVASYVHAVEEEDPNMRYDAAAVLRLGKEDGKFETCMIPRAEFESDFEGFLGTLQMYYWMRQLELDRKYAKEEAKAKAKELKEAAKAEVKALKAAAKAAAKAAKAAAKPRRTKLKKTEELEVAA